MKKKRATSITDKYFYITKYIFVYVSRLLLTAGALTFLSSLKGLPNVCKRLGCSGSASRRG